MNDSTDGELPISAALERRLERLGLLGREGTWADRYLLCEHALDPPHRASAPAVRGDCPIQP
ncbi:MAG: hypothetical protein WDO56_26510 [Gammaproteobacteria bacterium]